MRRVVTSCELVGHTTSPVPPHNIGCRLTARHISEATGISCESALSVLSDLFKLSNISLKGSKAVPLHVMEAHGRRGGIVPTHI
jgi:hypothetical protein